MIKKVLKAVVVGVIWSVLYLFVSRCLFVLWAGFDYFSIEDWKLIEHRWKAGAVIKNVHDYLVLFYLLMLVPVWLLGWKYWYRLNYLKVLLWPFEKFSQLLLSRYSLPNKRIILKNIGTTVKVEEEIKLKTAAIKPEDRNEADKIRQAVSEKLRESQKNKQ